MKQHDIVLRHTFICADRYYVGNTHLPNGRHVSCGLDDNHPNDDSMAAYMVLSAWATHVPKETVSDDRP